MSPISNNFEVFAMVHCVYAELGNVGAGDLGYGIDVCTCCCGPAHIHAAPSPLLHRVLQTLLHQSELLIANRPIRSRLCAEDRALFDPYQITY